MEQSLVGMKKVGRFLFRGVRKLVKPGIDHQSALKIQCAWRAYEANRNGVVRQRLFLKQKQNRLLRESKIQGCVAIQKMYRGYCVRVRLGSRKGDAATCIQVNWRLFHARQWFKRTIQEIRAQRKGASSIIQNSWRKYHGRHNYLSMIMVHRKKLPACIVIQQYYRHYLGLKKYYARLEMLKKKTETTLMGKTEVEVLRRCLEDYTLMDQMNRGNQSIKFVLQQCFHYWCQGITPDDAYNVNNKQVPLHALTLTSGSKFKIFCHQAYLSTAPPVCANSSSGSGGNNASVTMSQAELDTVFASKKGKNDRGLTFTTFVLFLREIADRYYYHDRHKYYKNNSGGVEYSYAALRRPQPPAAAAATTKRTTVKTDKRLSREEKKQQNDLLLFHIRQGPALTTKTTAGRLLVPWLVGYSGQNARVLLLLQERILLDPQLSGVVQLGRKESRKRIDLIIGRKARTIQNRWRGIEARVGYLNAKEQAIALRSLTSKMKAATVIQTCIGRSFLSKKRMKEKAGVVYIEYQQQPNKESKKNSNNHLTWYNPRTGKSFSPYAPSMLTLKIGNPTRNKRKGFCQSSMLPHVDKMFTLKCTQCIGNESTGSR